MYTSVVVRRWLQLNDVIRMGWSSHKDRWRNFISFYTGYKKHLFWRHTDALSSSMLDEHARSEVISSRTTKQLQQRPELRRNHRKSLSWIIDGQTDRPVLADHTDCALVFPRKRQRLSPLITSTAAYELSQWWHRRRFLHFQPQGVYLLTFSRWNRFYSSFITKTVEQVCAKYAKVKE